MAASCVVLAAGGLYGAVHGHLAWGLAGMVVWLVVAGVVWRMSKQPDGDLRVVVPLSEIRRQVEQDRQITADSLARVYRLGFTRGVEVGQRAKEREQ